jgi:hypothetical protein
VILFVMLFEQAIFRGTGDDAAGGEAGMEEKEDQETKEGEGARAHTDTARTG